MATTIQAIVLPDELAAAITRRAEASGVTVAEQIVQDLALVEEDLGALPEGELLALIAQDRARMASKGITVNEQFLHEAKNWGRR